jgi:hypothetical protein
MRTRGDKPRCATCPPPSPPSRCARDRRGGCGGGGGGGAARARAYGAVFGLFLGVAGCVRACACGVCVALRAALRVMRLRVARDARCRARAHRTPRARARSFFLPPPHALTMPPPPPLVRCLATSPGVFGRLRAARPRGVLRASAARRRGARARRALHTCAHTRISHTQPPQPLTRFAFCRLARAAAAALPPPPPRAGASQRGGGPRRRRGAPLPHTHTHARAHTHASRV